MGFIRGRLRSALVGLSCIVYSLTVATIAFTPALAALWRITRPGAGHGNVSVAADNTLMMHISMSSSGLPTWTGSVNIGALLLWMLGPPLLLWLAWLASGPRRPEATLSGASRIPSALDAPSSEPYVRSARAKQKEQPHER